MPHWNGPPWHFAQAILSCAAAAAPADARSQAQNAATSAATTCTFRALRMAPPIRGWPIPSRRIAVCQGVRSPVPDGSGAPARGCPRDNGRGPPRGGPRRGGSHGAAVARSGCQAGGDEQEGERARTYRGRRPVAPEKNPEGRFADPAQCEREGPRRRSVEPLDVIDCEERGPLRATSLSTDRNAAPTARSSGGVPSASSRSSATRSAFNCGVGSTSATSSRTSATMSASPVHVPRNGRAAGVAGRAHATLAADRVRRRPSVRRSGRRHQSELAEQLGLIEVEMFRGQFVAANLVSRHPAKVDLPSRDRDVPCRRAHDPGVRADEPALDGDDGSFDEKARRLKTPVRKRVPEHTEEAQNSSRPCTDAFGATTSASSLHGSASASRALNASTCRSTTRLGSAIRPYLLLVAVRGYSVSDNR